MADQPTEVTVLSQTTPGHTVMSDDAGARSVYDPPTQSPAAVSAAALANQLQDMLTGDGVGSDSAGGVQRTTMQTAPGLPPVTFHTASYGYDIPLA
jgi:hypothetical protein